MAPIASVEESTTFVAYVGETGWNYFSSWEEGRRSWTSKHIIIVNDICTAGTTEY